MEGNWERVLKECYGVSFGMYRDRYIIRHAPDRFDPGARPRQPSNLAALCRVCRRSVLY